MTTREIKGRLRQSDAERRLLAAFDAVASANEIFPGETRWAKARRDAFVKGWQACSDAVSASPNAYTQPKEDANDAS